MADAPQTERAQGVVTTEAHDDQHEKGFHAISGFRVGETSVPFSAIIVFLFIAFIAMISWIPTQGF
jgi:phosphotransferase system  glucose/maltose/N-acetylglucosamine-specific IIC component